MIPSTLIGPKGKSSKYFMSLGGVLTRWLFFNPCLCFPMFVVTVHDQFTVRKTKFQITEASKFRAKKASPDTWSFHRCLLHAFSGLQRSFQNFASLASARWVTFTRSALCTYSSLPPVSYPLCGANSLATKGCQ